MLLARPKQFPLWMDSSTLQLFLTIRSLTISVTYVSEV